MQLNKFNILVFALLSNFFVFNLSFGQDLQITFTNQNIERYNLEEIKKTTFNNNSMNVHLLDGSVITWSTDLISNYKFVASTVGIHSKEKEELDINLYPNPTKNTLHIDLLNLQVDNTISAISIIDMLGKKLKSFIPNSNMQIEINIEDLSRGTYLLMIESKNSIVTKTIFKD